MLAREEGNQLSSWAGGYQSPDDSSEDLSWKTRQRSKGYGRGAVAAAADDDDEEEGAVEVFGLAEGSRLGYDHQMSGYLRRICVYRSQSS